MNDEQPITISSGEDYKEWQEFQKKVEGYKQYLNYAVKEGYIDAETANDIVDHNEWERVEYMMNMSDLLYEVEIEK